MRLCKTCQLEKPESSFYKSGKYFQSYCKPCSVRKSSEERKKHPEVYTKHARACHHRLKALIIEAYGSKCNCCGEAQAKFLTIDHIFNDGFLENQGPSRRSSHKLYRKIKNLGFPKDKYQLLCWNCNCGKQANKGICPHKDLQ